MKYHTFDIHTLGCKVNIYESDAIAEGLKKGGLREVDFSEKADVYIINTCTVTNIADKKSRQMLHRARKLNPEALIVAAGCYVDAARQNESMGRLLSDSSVDIFVSNKDKKELAELILKRDREEDSEQDPEQKEGSELELSSISGHTRAFMKIQDGCNLFCSYCIIPFVRGRLRSRPLGSIVSEARRLSENGISEIVLSGIHLSSYGGDVSLLDVVRGLNDIEGIKRIRLGSLEPRLITEEFAGELSEVEKLCPGFHLALQSGSDSVLKRMRRRYTVEEYKKSCGYLRKYFDKPTITTDIIVGFPMETEEEFADTMSLVEELRLYEANVFKYSRRAGTKADLMEGQIPEELKSERSERLLELVNRVSAEVRRDYLGGRLEMLCEERKLIGGESFMTGYSREYIRCAVRDEDGLMGQNELKSGIAKEIFNEKDMDEYLLLRL